MTTAFQNSFILLQSGFLTKFGISFYFFALCFIECVTVKSPNRSRAKIPFNLHKIVEKTLNIETQATFLQYEWANEQVGHLMESNRL